MVVDSSALVAILFGEADAATFADIIVRSALCLVSAVSVLEVSMVVTRQGDAALWADFDEFMARMKVQIVPFDAEQASLARDAFLRYGKGRHQARLNMGDCASYALAKSRSLPLLFKGNDFARTDIVQAV